MNLLGLVSQASSTSALATGYQIERSLRFNSADSAYLSRTPGSASNQKTWTWSGWVKRTSLSSTQFLFGNEDSGGSNGFEMFFTAGDLITVGDATSSFVWSLTTAQAFRDPSSWYHLVLAYDTTQATSTNRIKLYVNGVQISLSGSYPSLNYDGYINNTSAMAVGRQGSRNAYYFNGYLTDINFIDGQALDPTSFGEYNADTGVWQPKAYTGSYGTNGFYLDFADNSSTTALGYDAAGSNDWTVNNFSVTAGAGNDSLVDTPTPYGTDTGAGGEVRGNYATLNPLANSGSLSNGSLVFAGTGAAYRNAYATITIPSSVKTYIEVTLTNKQANGNNAYCGIDSVYNLSGEQQGVGFYGLDAVYTNGNLWTSINNAVADTSIATANNDVFMFAIDQASQKFWIGRNGTWLSSGDPATGANSLATISATDLYYFRVGAYNANNWTVNFGQRPFAYTAPSGFKALVTTNLPTPTILDGSDYFNTVLYTGDSSSSRAITGVGFQPDLVWLKARSAAYSHGLHDAVRGGSRFLISNATNAELVNDAQGSVSSFDSDGFTITAGATNNINFNASAVTHAAWNWKAGNSNVSNSDGSITSTVRANPTAGFSIVSWTSPNPTNTSWTVGHGLGVAPSLVINKQRGNVSGWYVYHSVLGGTKFLALNTTAAAATNSSVFNDTDPTSSVISFGGASGNSYYDASTTQISYCFSEVPGFSKFGSYTGNGSTDGPFVYTGFRPAFVLLKVSSTAGYDWLLFDSARNTYNVVDINLRPNLADAEGTQAANVLDFLSNGFKIRGGSTGSINPSQTIIYAAFAENPFKYSLAR